MSYVLTPLLLSRFEFPRMKRQVSKKMRWVWKREHEISLYIHSSCPLLLYLVDIISLKQKCCSTVCLSSLFGDYLDFFFCPLFRLFIMIYWLVASRLLLKRNDLILPFFVLSLSLSHPDISIWQSSGIRNALYNRTV